MTLAEFQKFCEKQAQKEAEKKKKERAEFEQQMASKRYYGNFKDFVLYEGGYWLAVKNNTIIDICDTKGEAWRLLYED